MISKEEYIEIYKMLDEVLPINGDCGKLCSAACCQLDASYEQEFENEDFEEEEADLGMYLLPGEEMVQDPEDSWLSMSEEDSAEYDFPTSWPKRTIFAKCRGPENCKREKRPIQCRTFPLYPHITEEGELALIYCDFELPYLCPLIEKETELNENFILATYSAWRRLIEEESIFDLIKQDSLAREEAGMGYRIVAYAVKKEA
jgi:hypothetical protein